MASTLFFAFSLCLLVCAVLSLPVTNDLKSVLSSKLLHPKLIESKPKFDTEMALNSGVSSVRDSKLVQNLDSVTLHAVVVTSSSTDSIQSLERIKRDLINSPGCPDGNIYFAKTCMTFERYEKMLAENDVE